MRRRFFIKIDEEIVTTITFLRFIPLSLNLIRQKSAYVVPLRGNTPATISSRHRHLLQTGHYSWQQ